MGYRVSWVAFAGLAPAQVHDRLRLAPNGEHEDVPESDYIGTKLADGRYLVFANATEWADDLDLAKLSRGTEIVLCSLSETVMTSSAAGWKDGRCLWSVTHDSSRGIGDLSTTGDLPAEYTAIRDRLRTEQQQAADCDYIFDIPLELARALTGFRHDDGAFDDWTVLTRRS